MTRYFTTIDSAPRYIIKLSLIRTRTYSMIIPKSLNIFGLKFKVKETALTGFLGLCDRLSSTILLEVAQNDEEKLHTLIHEMGHAVFGRTGICQSVMPDVEEIIVENFATALLENFDITIKSKT